MIIFQELATKLLKHEVINFKAWLYQLSKNHCLMILRSSKKFSKATIDVSLMQSEETVHLNGELEKEENFKTLQLCMEQLVSEQKKVIELFYLEGKSYNQVADITGIEWNKVRSFIQNGRRNLKICMDNQLKK
jgi:RNA polymerase sigma-70 factor (ECF subfamily)